jgi:hypothetical protein
MVVVLVVGVLTLGLAADVKREKNERRENLAMRILLGEGCESALLVAKHATLLGGPEATPPRKTPR